MPKPKLFLLPGWAVNSSIWDAVAKPLSDVYDLCYHDFPGYGKRQSLDGNLTLESLVDDALQQSPPDAIWLAWSLGTLVALKAALQSPDRIAKLVMVCPTAKFITAEDWPHGQTKAAMDNLAQRFENDYETALKRFLLLQAGTDAAARKIAKQTLGQIMQHPQPTWPTLNSGLDILRQTDLRPIADQITVPTRIIVAQEDRVIPPNAGIDLHQRISGSKLIELATGHAPFIEQPAQFIDAAIR